MYVCMYVSPSQPLLGSSRNAPTVTTLITAAKETTRCTNLNALLPSVPLCFHFCSSPNNQVSGCIKTIKMAVKGPSSKEQKRNVLIGVTGSVASVKLSKLVDELLLLQQQVPYISFIERNQQIIVFVFFK